jgi:hypothetical protein
MIQKTRYTDRQLLVSLLIQGIVEAEDYWGRIPTRAQVLEQIFPSSHGEPEADDLARLLHELLDELLEDWFDQPADWREI